MMRALPRRADVLACLGGAPAAGQEADGEQGGEATDDPALGSAEGEGDESVHAGGLVGSGVAELHQAAQVGPAGVWQVAVWHRGVRASGGSGLRGAGDLQIQLVGGAGGCLHGNRDHSRAAVQSAVVRWHLRANLVAFRLAPDLRLKLGGAARGVDQREWVRGLVRRERQRDRRSRLCEAPLQLISIVQLDLRQRGRVGDIDGLVLYLRLGHELAGGVGGCRLCDDLSGLAGDVPQSQRRRRRNLDGAVRQDADGVVVIRLVPHDGIRPGVRHYGNGCRVFGVELEAQLAW